MARTKSPSEVRSQYFPNQMVYLVPDGAKPPELSKRQERLLLPLRYFGWRAKSANNRAKLAKSAYEHLRDKILAILPADVYGLKLFGKRSVQIKATTSHFDKPVSAEEFIAYLGPHASAIVTGIAIPVERLLVEPENYPRLLMAMAAEFGEDLSKLIGVNYKKAEMWDLINSGQLPEPPEHMFVETPSESRTLRIESIDSGGRVIKKAAG